MWKLEKLCASVCVTLLEKIPEKSSRMDDERRRNQNMIQAASYDCIIFASEAKFNGKIW